MVMSDGLLTRNKRFRVRIPVYWLFSFSFSYKYSRESIGIHWNPFLSVGFWLLSRNNMDLRRHHVNENAFSLYPIFILSCHNYCRVYNFTHEKWIGRVETVHSSSKIQLYLLYLLYLLEFSGIFWNFDFCHSKKWNYFSKNQIAGIPKFSTFFDFQICGIPKIGTIFPKIKLSEFQNFQLFSKFRFLEFQKMELFFQKSNCKILIFLWSFYRSWVRSSSCHLFFLSLIS